jgi:hypothetical protein
MYHPIYNPAGYAYDEEEKVFGKYFLGKLIGGRSHYFGRNAVLKVKIEKYTIPAEKPFPESSIFKYTVEDIFPEAYLESRLVVEEPRNQESAHTHSLRNSLSYLHLIPPTHLVAPTRKPQSRMENALFEISQKSLDIDVLDDDSLDTFWTKNKIRATIGVSEAGELSFKLSDDCHKTEAKMIRRELIPFIANKCVYRY